MICSTLYENGCKMLFCTVYFLSCYLYDCNAQLILLSQLHKSSSFYFDTSSTLTNPTDYALAQQPNGVVIVDFGGGNLSKVCMNYLYGSQAATQICKLMDYTNPNSNLSIANSLAPMALALISSKKSSPNANLQIINCSLDDCVLLYKEPLPYSPCANNNQDLHVFCMHRYAPNTEEICKSENCTLMIDNSSKAIYVVSKGNSYSFCGNNLNFGLNEAIMFCTMLGQYNELFTPLITYTEKNFLIGGFTNMFCPVNSISLKDCNNVHPYDRATCTPMNNIGVKCFPDPNPPSTVPFIICNSTTMLLYWNYSVHGFVNTSNVDITFANGMVCIDTTKYTDNNGTTLVVNFTNCQMNQSGDDGNIYFSFLGKRSYPLDNSIQTKGDDLFNASCVLPRYDNQSQGPLSIDGAILPPGTGGINVPVVLTVYSDPNFQIPINKINTVTVGTTIYVKVQLHNQTPGVTLLLINCYMVSSINSNKKRVLISDRCSAYSGLYIRPIDANTMSFYFPLFVLDEQGQSIYCDTSKCITHLPGCAQQCQ